MKTSGGMQTKNLKRERLGKKRGEAEGDSHTPGKLQFAGMHLWEPKQNKHRMGIVPQGLAHFDQNAR